MNLPISVVESDHNAPFELTGAFDKRAKRAYARDGVVLAREVVSESLRSAVCQDMNALLTLLEPRVGLQPWPGADVPHLSQRVRRLLDADPGAQAALYDALNHMPSLHRVASDPTILRVVRGLLSPTVSIHPRLIVLMAPPDGSWHVPSWHQDWYYNEGPHSTLTLYAPLQRTDEERGVLSYALGEHPLYPHGEFDVGRPCKWHHISPEVSDRFDRTVTPTVEAGDAVFFHSLVPHAARVNRTDGMRFVINLRYFDLQEQSFADARWRVGAIQHARDALSRKPSA